jgi:hypothetical protein
MQPDHENTWFFLREAAMREPGMAFLFTDNINGKRYIVGEWDALSTFLSQSEDLQEQIEKSMKEMFDKLKSAIAEEGQETYERIMARATCSDQVNTQTSESTNLLPYDSERSPRTGLWGVLRSYEHRGEDELRELSES